jgi:hypothetical protein
MTTRSRRRRQRPKTTTEERFLPSHIFQYYYLSISELADITAVGFCIIGCEDHTAVSCHVVATCIMQRRSRNCKEAVSMPIRLPDQAVPRAIKMNQEFAPVLECRYRSTSPAEKSYLIMSIARKKFPPLAIIFHAEAHFLPICHLRISYKLDYVP